MKQIINRVKAPTPPFFKTVRLVGLILAAVAGTIAAAPIAVPVVVTQVAAYLALAGAVASAVSQTAVHSASAGGIDQPDDQAKSGSVKTDPKKEEQ